jgi:hypothetical protein
MTFPKVFLDHEDFLVPVLPVPSQLQIYYSERITNHGLFMSSGRNETTEKKGARYTLQIY